MELLKTKKHFRDWARAASIKSSESGFELQIERLLESLNFSFESTRVGGYRFKNPEPNLDSLFFKFNHAFFPQVQGDRHMDFVEADSETPWDLNSYKILEPQASQKQRQDLDLIFVPGLAFDHRMTRLGRGAGYYDSFLKQTSALKVGVCLRSQFFSQQSLPRDPWDCPMDYVLTEKFIYKRTS